MAQGALFCGAFLMDFRAFGTYCREKKMAVTIASNFLSPREPIHDEEKS
jgi:hypothetical protein